jgi:diaminopimelate decarboxylase
MNLQSVLMQSPERHQSFARAMHSTQQRDQNCRGTFFGPTCDSMDVIAKDTEIEELFVGDWLAFEQMGAYTNAAATTFNGMPKPLMVYARSKAPSPSVA